MGEPETVEPSGRLGIDAAALEAWVAEHVPERAGPLDVRQIRSGQSNPTYLVDSAAGRMVLRRKPPGDLLPSAHAIDREYRVMRALGEQGYPVPPMLALCEDRGVVGTEFYLMGHVEGRVFFDTGLPELSREDRRAAYDALIDRLADLHLIDWQAAGLGDFGRPSGYVARQVRRWSEQYRKTETGTIPEMDRLIDWLPGAVERLPDESCLVHGDYRLDNVMFAPDRPGIVAVLDWELSTLGHPLADLGYLLMTWTFPAGLRYGMAELDLEALNIPTLGRAAERYGARTGRSGLPDLDLLLAFNIFRIAAILQGVYHRGLSGNAASDEALSMGADVARLARLADARAARAG
ncbi:MAG TPA: phosphotransferase family protein [Thermohalobaculum sp.]|nr:phosphotransferase family protein [Thermohalobaculum sp.]